MTAPVPESGAGSDDTDVYRPSMLAAYRDRPRGRPRRQFDPETMGPRLRWLIGGALLLAATVAAGLLVRVPMGPVVVVAGTNGGDLVLAMPGIDVPDRNEAITLLAGDGLTVHGTVRDLQTQSGAPVTMVLVYVRGGVPPGIGAGTQLVLDRGSRPILVHLLDGGDET